MYGTINETAEQFVIEFRRNAAAFCCKAGSISAWRDCWARLQAGQSREPGFVDGPRTISWGNFSSFR